MAFSTLQSPNTALDNSPPNVLPPTQSILVVSHREKQCGIYQYGLNITETLKKSKRYQFHYAECATGEELFQTVVNTQPSVIIYNYYPATMGWLTPAITRILNMPQIGMIHEVTQDVADAATFELFDYHLAPDPTLEQRNTRVFKTRRIIPPYINDRWNLPERITVGSFGFGFADKGFEKVIMQVQTEFDEADIRLLLPFNDMNDVAGENHALATAQRCRDIPLKPGIKLEIHHDFLDKLGLLDFLAQNTINCFFYQPDKQLGISSTIEHALAVQRPMAINKCGMFRHVYNAQPSICIEDRSLKEIIESGIAPLVPFYNAWGEVSYVDDMEKILDRVLALSMKN